MIAKRLFWKISCCLMAGLLPLMAFSAIVPKEVIHFYVDDHNKVSSHITFYDQKVIVERYYQKPYQSGSNQVSFRTQDRATYQIDCQQQKVALLTFSVVKPRSRAIYKRQNATNWLPASGPEFEVVFRKVCQAELEKPAIMHPDQWLLLRDDALSKKADQRDIFVKRPLQQTLATTKRDKKTTESAQSDELLKNSTLKIASLTRDYSSPVLMAGQQETISRIVQDIGFDCEKKKAVIFRARFYNQHHMLVHQREYRIGAADDLTLWFTVPQTGAINQLYQTVCVDDLTL